MKIQKPLLRKKILKMVIADLNIQRATHFNRVLWNKKIREHTTNLKRIVNKHGWPTISMVGKKGNWGTWLITQHSDHDRSFQKKALKLMEDEIAKNPKNINKMNIASLRDRILTNSNKKQIYGSQFRVTKNSELIPYPIRDKKNLEARRKEYGLEPFRDLLKSAKEESERRRKKEKNKITIRIVI